MKFIYNNTCLYKNIYDELYNSNSKHIFALNRIKDNTSYDKLENITNNIDDNILKILFSNKYPLYFYPKENTSSFEMKIKMINMNGNKDKVVLSYDNNEYYYVHSHWYICCGSGSDSFILVNNNYDMNYYDDYKINEDIEMRNHFDYLYTKI